MKWPTLWPFARASQRSSTWKLSALQSWADMGIGSGPTAAGVAVSETTAEGLPTVFSCVRVIASAVAQLPLKLYRRTETGKTEAVDHPLFGVLHDLPNGEQTSYDLRQLLMTHLLLWGNCYAEIVRDDRGQVVALWPLMPWGMTVDRDSERRLRFTYRMGGHEQRWTHDPARPPIFRLMIHSLDGLTGRSPIRVLRESLGLTIALERFGAGFFSKGSTFGGVLSTPDELDDDQKKAITEGIEKYHKGADQAHRFLLLSGGWKYDKLGIPPEDAQFLESRKFQRSEICGPFGVPPHLIADLEKATFSNVEHESLRWLRDGLEPHLSNMEQAITRDLIGPRAMGRYYARFTRAAMLRGDLKSRTEALAMQRQNGVVNADEWRELEEMNPIGGVQGTTYIVNTAAAPIGQASGESDGKA